jgi:ATP-binding cassette, subfamily B, bacterial PglK
LISSIQGEEITFAPIVFFINLFEPKSILFFIAFFTFTVFLIKTAYLITIAYIQAHFSSSIFSELANKLSIFYSEMNYLDFISTDSSEKIRNITNESKMVMQGYLKPLFVLFNELFVVACFVIFLILYQPVIFFTLIGFMFTFAYLIYFYSRSKLKILGVKRIDADRTFLKFIQESLFAYKEIFLSNSQNTYKNKIQIAIGEVAGINKQDYFLKQIPRPMLELSMVAVITMLIWIAVYSPLSTSGGVDLLSILSIFVAAAFRILPSISRIIGSLQNINYFKASVLLFFDKLSKQQEAVSAYINNDKPKTNDFIEFINLSFSYSSKKNVFSDISFSIDRNDFVGIVGPSGSGKSTFLYLLMTLIKPTSGTVFNSGKDIFNYSSGWRSKIGYVPQSPYLMDDSILNNIIFGSHRNNEIDMQNIDRVLKMANLKSTIDALPEGVNTRIGENAVYLSGGQKQRISIARALYNSPEILILDEATSSLDKFSEDEIINEIANLSRDITIIMSTHKPSTLKRCNKIIKVNNSSVIIEEINLNQSIKGN